MTDVAVCREHDDLDISYDGSRSGLFEFGTLYHFTYTNALGRGAGARNVIVCLHQCFGVRDVFALPVANR